MREIDPYLEKYGLVPNIADLPAVRELLAKEAEAERVGEERMDDLALLCCVQLFSRGLLEDVLRIWEAKQSGFDLFCYLDGEFLLGAGITETIAYLQDVGSEEAELALDYITEGYDAGNLEDFSPAAHLKRYKSYFGV